VEKKHVAGVLIVLAVLGGVFVMPKVRLLQFKMDADKYLREDLGRFPNAPAIIALDKALTKVAQGHGFQSVTSSKKITARSLAGTSKMVYVLYLVAKVDDQEVNFSHRIETGGFDQELEALQEAGVKVVGTE
jgi:hypothetical protein